MRAFVLIAMLTPVSPHAVILGLFHDAEMCAIARPAFQRFYADFRNAQFDCVPRGFAPLRSGRPEARP